jgi:predicted nucleotidyltransferase component of viral defense system
MKIPIVKKLKKRQQVQVAMLQDMLVEIIYKIVDKPVLHGGTGIWRCYSGNRFSEDLDFYFKPENNFETRLARDLRAFGMRITKFKDTGNVIFCKISDGETEIRLESNLVDFKNHIVRDYEKIDGSPVTILTLDEGNLIEEKMDAYLGRRFIRDIYDVYHLSGMVDPDRLRAKVTDFLARMEPPVDESVLKVLIISGAIPTFDAMVRTLKSRFLP